MAERKTNLYRFLWIFNPSLFAKPNIWWPWSITVLFPFFLLLSRICFISPERFVKFPSRSLYYASAFVFTFFHFFFYIHKGFFILLSTISFTPFYHFCCFFSPFFYFSCFFYFPLAIVSLPFDILLLYVTMIFTSF